MKFRFPISDFRLLATLALCLCAFVVFPSFAALDVAVIDIQCDVDKIRYAKDQAEFERMDPIRFYRWESVRFNITATHGKTDPVDLSGANIFVRWEAYTSPGSTNAYIHKTGSVVSSTGGQSTISLTPEEAGLPAGSYYSYVRAFEPVNGTNQSIGTLAYNRLEVIDAPDANNYKYLGPYPILPGVTSVNGMTGTVVITAAALGAATGTPVYVELDTNALSKVAIETNRAIQAEALLYPRSNPSNWVTRAEATNGMQAAGNYATGTPVYVELDTNALSKVAIETNRAIQAEALLYPRSNPSNWVTRAEATNGMQAAGNYATGTPVYVELDTNALAKVAIETNRAIQAEALLYPRSNPSNWVTRAEATNGMQAAGNYATGTPVYVELDTNALSKVAIETNRAIQAEALLYPRSNPSNWVTRAEATNGMQAAGNYATGTPVYVELDTNALSKVAIETNRAIQAEALLYPRSNPSNWVTRAEATNGMQAAGNYATGTPVYVELDTNALAKVVIETNRAIQAEALLYPRSNPSNWVTRAEATNGMQAAGNYATGTPVYVELDTNALAKVAGLGVSLTNTQGDVSSMIGNIATSYVVVTTTNGTMMLPYSSVSEGRPWYDNGSGNLAELFHTGGSWQLNIYDWGIFAVDVPSESLLPPTNGWPAGITVDWHSGQSGTIGKNGSVAYGYLSQVSGAGATAFGLSTRALADGAFASGFNTSATGIYALAFGEGSVANNNASAAFGYYTHADGEASVAFGDSAAASGYASAAFGEGSVANNNASAAFGYSTHADGEASVAFGDSAAASGYASAAFGYSIANGDASAAFGYSTASGGASVSFGEGAAASGYASAAFGESSQAQGRCSMSMGKDAYALHEGSFIFADFQGEMAQPFNSVTNDTFNVRAVNGVYLKTPRINIDAGSGYKEGITTNLVYEGTNRLNIVGGIIVGINQ